MSPQDKKLEAELFESEDSVVDEGTDVPVTSDGYDYRMFMLAFTDLFSTKLVHGPSGTSYLASPAQCSFSMH
jgi:hypothetical protein